MEKKQTLEEAVKEDAAKNSITPREIKINCSCGTTFDVVGIPPNNEYVDYKQQVTEQFNPRLFNKPFKELPTDEEIYELAEKILSVDYLSFTEGAKWMRDKIKGGNKE